MPIPHAIRKRDKSETYQLSTPTEVHNCVHTMVKHTACPRDRMRLFFPMQRRWRNKQNGPYGSACDIFYGSVCLASRERQLVFSPSTRAFQLIIGQSSVQTKVSCSPASDEYTRPASVSFLP